MNALVLPVIDPVAFSVLGVTVHWYGLLWLAAFGQFYFVTRRLGQGLVGAAPIDRVVDNLFFAVALGSVIGGRIGYVLFYGLDRLAEDPLWALRIWEGGMSFHGGLLGVVASLLVCARLERDVGLFRLGDLVALGAPLGLACGRLGNFINAELWGRASDMPWAVVYPHLGPEPRHPSQLYQMLGEGVLLFALLFVLSRKKPQTPGLIAAAFLTGYGLVRFVLEFFREPDGHIGYLAWDLTAGQWLSLPVLAAGLLLLWLSLSRRLS